MAKKPEVDKENFELTESVEWNREILALVWPLWIGRIKNNIKLYL